MIQDIGSSALKNNYFNREPDESDTVLVFDENSNVLVSSYEDRIFLLDFFVR